VGALLQPIKVCYGSKMTHTDILVLNLQNLDINKSVKNKQMPGIRDSGPSAHRLLVFIVRGFQLLNVAAHLLCFVAILAH